MILDNNTKSMAKSASISAKVFRADGTLKEDLGVVSFWHKNPFKRIAFEVKQKIKSLKRNQQNG